MSNQNKLIIVSLLVLVSLFLFVDVFSDFTSGGVGQIHVLVEAFMSFVCLIAAYWVWKKIDQLSKVNRSLAGDNLNNKLKLEEMTRKYKRLTEGLKVSIELNFEAWKLTNSEKEIGKLLIKGNSIKEIAQIRETSEATVRQQAVKIYEKSGLAGRAEFSAFFLQDFLESLD